MSIDADALKTELLSQIEAAPDLAALDGVRVSALGKKGRITAAMKGLGGLDPEARKATGQALNAVKDALAAAIDARKDVLETAEMNTKLEAERIDVTLPVRPEQRGKLHPISQTIDEVVAIFGAMGLSVREGPNIEDGFHNFTALNMPPEHPARQMMDTFYLKGEDGEADMDRVLRTHTSPVQIRTMQSEKPPIRIIAPGRTYRSDYDATHTPMFHQVEGLVIDKDINFGHLKGCLQEFCDAYFEVDHVPLRFRPSYFPFTEPSAEVDIGCSRKGGELKIGAGDDWLEILGSGMVHPRVLDYCGIDPEEYQGFAFGMGIERIAMLKYGIPDLRTFYEADVRWLKHYGFAPIEVASLERGLTP
ncbi:MAG: phenylalanine--tRNA ligase subunit alpha [Alphaproteobacteria bacterium]|nr:phenylalanine--tRNA ligase subunit alpha [Alphaproteobacteria bacterium]